MENNKPEKHIVSASATIPARRERVYSLIADYNDGHPRILPKQFMSLVVDRLPVSEARVALRSSRSWHGSLACL